MAYLPISRLIRHLPAIAGNIFNLVKKQANLRRVLILTQVIGLRIVILEKTFLLVNQKYAKKKYAEKKQREEHTIFCRSVLIIKALIPTF